VKLDRYLDRIGFVAEGSERPRPSLACLREITRAHTHTIAFENLNTLMRLPVRLDLDALEAKLVDSKRGGYCFEQNGLFALVLEEIGLSVSRLAARVVWGLDPDERWRNPRTHMVLLVDVDDGRYLCDVGFGGVTPTAPLRLDTEREQVTPHETFRLIGGTDGYMLQVSAGGQWRDVYSFDLQPQAQIDYEMANHYVATHPESRFRDTLMAARAFEGGRYMLRNDRLSTYIAGEEKQVRRLQGAAEITATLDELFGIVVGDAQAMRAAIANIRQ
jgi:N-hydroxyarylamine O-acetyltransferase